jgi:outer membrane cobalamin receptor
MATFNSTMKKYLFIACLILFGKALHAQGVVTGRVMSATTHESLIGVTVFAGNTPIAVTDIDGNYSVSLRAGSHSLLFKMIGMTDRAETIEIKDEETSILIIMMKESAKELGLIVVSAGKFEQRIEDVTVSMNVIKPSIIEAKNTVSMDNILNQSPSVNVIDGQANIRGGSGWSYGAGSRVLILVDDMPMLTADAGDAKWSFLPVENIDQIEIIKGASSALFGSSAMNGVINVRTAYPTDKPQTRATFYSGVYDTNQKIKLNDTTYDLNWSGSIPQRVSGMTFFHSEKIQNFDLVVGGNMLQDQKFKRGEFENRVRFNTNTRYRFKKAPGLSIGANFNTQFADGSLSFIWQSDTNAYIPQSLSDYNTYRTSVDPYITYVSPNGTSLKFRGRYFRSNNLNNTNQQSKAESYYREYQFQKPIQQKLILTIGAVETYSKVISQLYSGNHDGANLAFYAQGDLKISKWNFSLGGRVEHNRIDTVKDKFTPVLRAGANYNVFGSTHLRASYGQGYRYPAISEKFIKTEIGDAGIYPNDSIKSERGFSVEIGVMQGIKIGNWKGYADAAVFYTEYRNMIEFTFSQWKPPAFDFATMTFDYGIGFKPLNIGDTRVKGFDLSLSGEGSIGPLNISVVAGYTYMVPEAIRYDSAYMKAQHKLDRDTNVYRVYLGSDSTTFLKYRFNHMAKADVSIAYRKISIGASMQYNSFMKNIDQLFVDPLWGSLITPGVAHYRQARRKGDAIYDARAAYQLNSRVKLAFIVKNVFNYIYMQRPADMLSPRVFVGQMSVTL